MNSPSPPWFTVAELAERWTRWNMTITVINRHIASGELIASDRYTNPESKDYWVDRSDLRKKVTYRMKYEELFKEGYDYDGTYIKRTEVERFEKEHDLTTGGNQKKNIPENLVNETDADLVKRLTPKGVKLEDNDKKDDNLRMKIAQELKTAIPTITSHRVGKLLTNPNDKISISGFQKRGRKYLGLTTSKKAK